MEKNYILHLEAHSKRCQIAIVTNNIKNNHEKRELHLFVLQPATQYFAWQLEVMLTNFVSLIPYNHRIHILVAYNTKEIECNRNLEIIKKVERKFENNRVYFFYYEDLRIYPISYISSIRPNILKQHFYKYPELRDDVIFYHDCDIVFTKFPDFIFKCIADDNNWYVSNTISYIGHEYILSKGGQVLNEMCKIVGIHPALVKERQNQSGGAQYIMKNVDWLFWDKVEKDSELLFAQISMYNSQRVQRNPKYHPLQIWCADMWAILWAAWMRRINTNIIPEMDFCWATDPIERWEQTYIMHNAGVVPNDVGRLFFKGAFTGSLPFKEINIYDGTLCSHKYFEIISQIGENSCLYE